VTCPVGVFDSGVGGLTVARAIVNRLPDESLLYLGDTARVPYGNKSPETVRRYSLNIAAKLVDSGAKALVVACNTASAYALEAVREAVSVPVVGVIAPVAARAAGCTRNKRIGVVGTRGTVRSGAYVEALAALDPSIAVHQRACPLLVPLAEEGWTAGRVPVDVVRTYLSGFAGTEIDTLVLGCTHYPILREIIEAVIIDEVGHPVRVLDSASATAEALARVLGDSGALAEPSSAPHHRFLVTDDSETFLTACARFFGAPVGKIEHTDL
jgi:glutamate racemase